MGRFYFNFRQGELYCADDQGCDFESAEAAYLAAFEAAADIWGELLSQRENPLACSFEVSDAKGNDLFALPFSELLETCASKRSPAQRPKANQVEEARESRRIVKQALSDRRVAYNKARSTLDETLRLLRGTSKIIDS